MDEALDCEDKVSNEFSSEFSAETNHSANGGAVDTNKHQKRRYWTQDEEQRFFDIWGRENWRLTRHGKNTLHFAQWSEELKALHGIDIKPEEIQGKVNQMRAKFRAVQKQVDLNKNAQRWKKYELVNKILKNEYRPKDAEPLAKETMQRNRDFPDVDSDYEVHELNNSKEVNNTTNPLKPDIESSHITAEHSTSNQYQMYNNSSNNDAEAKATNYTPELFADALDVNKNGGTTFEQPMSLIKQEEFQNEYQSFAYQTAQNHYAQTALSAQQTMQQLQSQQQPQPQLQEQQQPAESLQFHNLQTPQEMHEEQQMHQQYQTQPINLQRPEQHLQQHIQQQLQQLQQQLQPVNQVQPQFPLQSPQSNLVNNDASHAGAAAAPVAVPTQRRRYRTANSVLAAAAAERTANGESLEAIYVEEFKKQSTILEQQKEISRKQLQVEERKVVLMETYFPKILEMQEQIMSRLLQKP